MRAASPAAYRLCHSALRSGGIQAAGSYEFLPAHLRVGGDVTEVKETDLLHCCSFLPYKGSRMG